VIPLDYGCGSYHHCLGVVLLVLRRTTFYRAVTVVDIRFPFSPGGWTDVLTVYHLAYLSHWWSITHTATTTGTFWYTAVQRLPLPVHGRITTAVYHMVVTVCGRSDHPLPTALFPTTCYLHHEPGCIPCIWAGHGPDVRTRLVPLPTTHTTTPHHTLTTPASSCHTYGSDRTPTIHTAIPEHTGYSGSTTRYFLLPAFGQIADGWSFSTPHRMGFPILDDGAGHTAFLPHTPHTDVILLVEPVYPVLVDDSDYHTG